MKKLILILIGFFLITSCEKEVEEEKVPEHCKCGRVEYTYNMSGDIGEVVNKSKVKNYCTGNFNEFRVEEHKDPGEEYCAQFEW